MTTSTLIQSPTTAAELAEIRRAARGRPPKPPEQKCGTTTGYAQGCRCERCRAAVAAYQREYMARPGKKDQLALAKLLSTPQGRQALRDAGHPAAPARSIEDIL